MRWSFRFTAGQVSALANALIHSLAGALRLVPLFALLLTPIGCRSAEPVEITSPQLPAAQLPAADVVNRTTMTVGYSIEDRPITLITLGVGEEVVLLMASIHGNEPAGTPLLDMLHEALLAQPELLADRTVLLMPVTNPDGLARGSRVNVRGVDLNRNFPAGNRREAQRSGPQPLSEPEAQAIDHVLHTYQPLRIVSIHQPIACIDYDGPGLELALAMAAVCDLPVRRLGARPGSLGSYAGEDLGIPIITLELPRHVERESPAELWHRYGRALLVAIRGVD